MDDRVWYLGLGTLVVAVVGMFLDAALSTFNVDAGFYPFLGIFAGAVFGIGFASNRRKNGGNGNNGSGS